MEEAGNYGGWLLNRDHICERNDFEVGDTRRVMRCCWAPMLAHFERLSEFLRNFLLHCSPFESLLRIPTIHGHFQFFPALVERWRHETHTFHFPYNEMIVLPEHWALLIGMSFGGEPIVGKTTQGFSKVPQLLSQEPPPLTRSAYNFCLVWLRQWTQFWPDPAPGSREAGFVLCHFLLESIETVFCNTSDYYVHADWLMYVTDIDQLDWYDWDGASYAYLLCGLDDVVQKNLHSYVGLYPLLTAMEHMWRGHYFYHLRPKLLPLPCQLCEPDQRAALGVYNYKAYRYLLDLLSLDEVELRPFEGYAGLNQGAIELYSGVKEGANQVLLLEVVCILPPGAHTSTDHG